MSFENFENSAFYQALKGMVRRHWRDSQLFEDLLQEALEHFLREQAAHPDEKLAWYVENCRYYLLNWLNLGRSVDSYKRRHGQLLPDEQSGPADLPPWLENKAGCDDSLRSTVFARDAMALLLSDLPCNEQVILLLLVADQGVNSIARRFHHSHSWVLEHRRHIQSVARKLGILPFGN